MKSLKIVIFSAVVMFLMSVLDASAAPKMVEEKYEAPYGVLFNEEAYLRGETTYNQFVNVLVINKAAKGPTAQTLRLYTNRQLMLTTKVSTGREDFENINPVRGIINRFTKGTTKSHWRHTTRGFYAIRRVMSANYRSGESKFQMPHAMFFNEHKGLAVHQVPPDLSGGEAAGESALGRRASSGCVRVHKNVILDIRNAVEAAGRGDIPMISSRTGQILTDSQGRPRYEKAYRSLVIVEEH